MSGDRPVLHIRHARQADLVAVHAINEAAVPHVNSITLDCFQDFTRSAAYFRVASLANRVVGYLVAFAPGANYDSVNFLWFQGRYRNFLYIDRIAVTADARRRGVASDLYRDVFDFARPRTGLLTCEVNTRPPNAESKAFHEGFGFRQVGTQETEAGSKAVSLMAVELSAPG